MQKLLYSISLILIFATYGYAQKTEKEQVESSIHQYFEGWMTGDTAKLGKVMHESCKLKVYRDSEFIEINRTNYLSRFKPKTKESGTEGRIKMIDITGNIASAKCEIETPNAIFTDYFNLMKIQNVWYIVDKVSIRMDKK